MYSFVSHQNKIMNFIYKVEHSQFFEFYIQTHFFLQGKPYTISMMASGKNVDISTELVSKKYRVITLNVNGVVHTIHVPLDDEAQENTTLSIPSTKQSTVSTRMKRELTASDVLFSKKRKLDKNKNHVTANSSEARVTPISNNGVSTQQSCSGVNRPYTDHVPLTSSLTNIHDTLNVHTSTNVQNTASQGVTQTPASILSLENNATNGVMVSGMHTPSLPHNMAQYAQFQLPNNRHAPVQPAVNQCVVSHSSPIGTVNSNISTSNQFQTTKVVEAPGAQPLTLFPSQAVQLPHLQPPAIIESNGNITPTIQPLKQSQQPTSIAPYGNTTFTTQPLTLPQPSTIIVPDDNTTSTAQPLTLSQQPTSIALYGNTIPTTQPLTLPQTSTVIVPDDNSTSTAQPLALSQQPTSIAPYGNTTFTTQPLTLPQTSTVILPDDNTTPTAQPLALSQQPASIALYGNTIPTTHPLTLSQQPASIELYGNTIPTTQPLKLSQKTTIIIPDDNTTSTAQPLTLSQKPTSIALFANTAPTTQPFTLSQQPTIIIPDDNTTSSSQHLTLSQQPTIITPYGNTTSTSQPLILSQPSTIITPHGTTKSTTQPLTQSTAHVLHHNNILSTVAGITPTNTLAISYQNTMAMMNQAAPLVQQASTLPTTTANTLIQPGSILPTTVNTLIQPGNILPHTTTNTSIQPGSILPPTTDNTLIQPGSMLPTTANTLVMNQAAPLVQQASTLPARTINTLIQPASILPPTTINTLIQPGSILPTTANTLFQPGDILPLTTVNTIIQPASIFSTTNANTLIQPGSILPTTTANTAHRQTNILQSSTVNTVLPQATLAVNLPSHRSQNEAVYAAKQPKPVNSVAPIRNVNSADRVTKHRPLTTSTTTSTASATTQYTTALVKQSTHHITNSKTDPATLAKQMSCFVQAVKNNNKTDEGILSDSLSNSIAKKSKKHKHIDSRYVKILQKTNDCKSTAKVNPYDVKHKERSDKDKHNYHKETKESSLILQNSASNMLQNIAMLKKQSNKEKLDKEASDKSSAITVSAEDQISKIDDKETSWSKSSNSPNNTYDVEKSERKKHKKKRISKKKKSSKTDIKSCSVVLHRINMYGKKCVKVWDILPQLYPDIFDAEDN